MRTINHPDEVDDYVAVLFDEYGESGDTASMMTSLRVVTRVKGVSRKGVQKALSENGNPQFGRVNVIMHGMGYRLTAQKLPSSNHAHK